MRAGSKENCSAGGCTSSPMQGRHLQSHSCRFTRQTDAWYFPSLSTKHLQHLGLADSELALRKCHNNAAHLRVLQRVVHKLLDVLEYALNTSQVRIGYRPWACAHYPASERASERARERVSERAGKREGEHASECIEGGSE